MLKNYQWLASIAGREVLSQIEQWRQTGIDVTTIAKRLRKQLPVERARLALEMDDLRERARVKFSRSKELWFTRVGLEQSSSEPIARYKAARYPALQCHDLCCGVGGDLMSMANHRVTIGWERDSVTAWMASQNLDLVTAIKSSDSMTSGAKSRVINRSIPDPAELRESAWHLDPDRRRGTRRTTTLNQFSPGLDYVEDLFRQCPHGGLKVAPATSIPDNWLQQGEREWIGEGRECKQQIVWFGDCARRRGRCAATVVDSKLISMRSESIDNEDLEPASICEGIQSYLYEPHATVLAAGLRDALATKFGMSALAVGHVILTAETRHLSLLFATFRVLDNTELDRKRIQSMLDRHDVGEVELKPHGLEANDKWRLMSFPRRSGHRRTLWLMRIGKHYSAILCERISINRCEPQS